MVYQIALAITPATNKESAEFQKWYSLSFFIITFGSLCSNACYIILLLSWSQLYFKISDTFKMVYIQNGFSIGLFISFLLTVVLIIIFLFYSSIQVVNISVLLSTLYFLLISIAFLVMWYLMRRRVRRHKWLQVKTQIMHKINYCTFIASFFMFCRVVFDVMEVMVTTWDQNYFVYPIYFLLLDIFPTILMIVVLRTNGRLKTLQNPTVYSPLLEK